MFAEEATLISKNIPSPDLTRLRPLSFFFYCFLFFVCLFFLFQSGPFSHMKVANFLREETEAFHLACRRLFFFSLSSGF